MSESELVGWLEAHLATLIPLQTTNNLSVWRATASGRPEDYEASSHAELELHRQFSDREAFAILQQARARQDSFDPLVARQIELLYRAYLGNQFDPSLMEHIVCLSSEISEKFNTFRAHVGSEVLIDNQVSEVLRIEPDVLRRKAVWEASKVIGDLVSKPLIELVHLRNRSARELGYRDYYALALELGEQRETDLIALVDDMAARTDAPFAQVKAELDEALAARFQIPVSELRPWHYEDRFFQEAPAAGTVYLDPYYEQQDIVGISAWYFDSLGMPARDVIDRSDLYPRDGKYQHAYCMDLDRAGDVRVMCSVNDSLHWMDTMLHELGHAVYNLGITEHQGLPYTLRSPAHTFTTEGVALLMGRMASNPHWMRHAIGLSEADVQALEPALRTRSRRAALIFARWCMVMTYFERELYRDPDQDLNALWWRLVKRYQGMNPPDNRNAPDWAAKIHLVGSPVYYHNYLLGEIFASQLHDAVCRDLFPGEDPAKVSYVGHPEVGAFFQEKVFYQGAASRWEDFVTQATGEPLSARAFAKAFYNA